MPAAHTITAHLVYKSHSERASQCVAYVHKESLMYCTRVLVSQYYTIHRDALYLERSILLLLSYDVRTGNERDLLLMVYAMQAKRRPFVQRCVLRSFATVVTKEYNIGCSMKKPISFAQTKAMWIFFCCCLLGTRVREMCT